MDIKLNQNKIGNLKYLFGKEFYYNKSSYQFLLAFILIFPALIISLVQSLINVELLNDWCLVILGIISALTGITSIVFEQISKRNAIKGANYLDLFDHKVLETPRKGNYNISAINGEVEELIKEHKSYFEQKCSKEGVEGHSYLDWYENVPSGKKNDQVMYCQKQCLVWSKPMFICSLILCVSIISIYIFSVVFLYSKLELIKFITFILFNLIDFISIGMYLFCIIKKVVVCDRIVKDIDVYLDNPNRKSSVYIEEKIYDFRKLPAFSLKFSYKKIYRRKHEEEKLPA